MAKSASTNKPPIIPWYVKKTLGKFANTSKEAPKERASVIYIKAVEPIKKIKKEYLISTNVLDLFKLAATTLQMIKLLTKSLLPVDDKVTKITITSKAMNR